MTTSRRVTSGTKRAALAGLLLTVPLLPLAGCGDDGDGGDGGGGDGGGVEVENENTRDEEEDGGLY